MARPIGLDEKCGACLLYGAIEGLSDGLVLVDTRGRVFHVNRRAEEILDVQGRDLRGSPLRPRLRHDGLRAFFKAALGEAGPVTSEIAFPGGRTMRATVSACVSESGEPIGRALLLRDITRERTIQVELSTSVARRLVEMAGGEESGEGLSVLTARERQVLQLVAAGLGNSAIGARLNVSVHTVVSHLKHVYAKLDLTSRTQAAAYALSHGLRPPGK